MYKFILLGVFVFSFINGLFWLSILSFLAHVMIYTGFEMFIVVVLLDGYLGAFYEVPWLSIGTGALLFLVTIIKKRLLLYT